MSHAARRAASPLVIRVLAVAAVAAGTLFSPLASADAPVAVGEVVAQNADAADTIKTTLEQELAKVKVPSGKRYIVSASLVKLETKSAGSDATTSAIVSLAIRDAKDGAIRGVIQGTSAITTKPTDKEARRLVVETAVRGATKNLPAVIAKQ